MCPDIISASPLDDLEFLLLSNDVHFKLLVIL